MAQLHELVVSSERIQRQREVGQEEQINCFARYSSFFLIFINLAGGEQLSQRWGWINESLPCKTAEPSTERGSYNTRQCCCRGGKNQLFLTLPSFLSAKLLLALQRYKHKEIFGFYKGTGWLYSSRRRRFTKNKLSGSNLTFELVISRVMIHTT